MAVPYAWLIWVSTLKVAAGFALLFVWLPRRLFPQREDATPIERFFENLVVMTFVSVVLVQALSLTRIYGALSLVGALALLYLGVRRVREGRLLMPRLRRAARDATVFVLDALDGVIDVPTLVRARLGSRAQAWRARHADPAGRLHLLLFTLVLGLAAWLRWADGFRRAALAYSDAYYHLEALKRLEMGTPYWEDLYPKGFQAFMSLIHQVTWLDAVTVVKLCGPLVGVLIVLSVYHAAFTLTRDRNAALLSMLVAGIVDGWSSVLFARLGSEHWAAFFGSTWGGPFMLNERQTAALPQEFALVFLLPTLVLAHRYWSGRGARRDLVLLFMSVTVVCMSHWLVTVGLVGGLLLLAGLHLCRLRLSFRQLAMGTAALAAAGAVGNFQFVFFLLGSQLAHADTAQTQYARDLSGRYSFWLSYWKDPLPVPPVLWMAGVLALVVAVGGLLLVRGSRRKVLWAFIGLYALLLTFEIRAVNLGVLYILPPDRTGEFLTLVLAVMVGGAWSLVTRFDPDRSVSRRAARARQVAMTLVLLGVLVVALPQGFASPPRYEYDALARFYYEVSRRYPPLQWTIVSNVEDYSKVLTRGWHINIEEFLARYRPDAAVLDLPTPFVFLLVEKHPLPATYKGAEHRRDEHRRLAEWVFVRAALRHDVQRYYEDESVLVYLLQPERELRG